mmetsp:Transcript_21364/g.47297  ORF Transcript_21364/g.47297 Transcript_21364/m.47297 type:complete len:96 (+) Transcript_21364:582-869(+)
MPLEVLNDMATNRCRTWKSRRKSAPSSLPSKAMERCVSPSTIMSKAAATPGLVSRLDRREIDALGLHPQLCFTMLVLGPMGRRKIGPPTGPLLSS